jgi:hypothetical protein
MQLNILDMGTYNGVAGGRALEVVCFAPQLHWDIMTAAHACTRNQKPLRSISIFLDMWEAANICNAFRVCCFPFSQ